MTDEPTTPENTDEPTNDENPEEVNNFLSAEEADDFFGVDVEEGRALIRPMIAGNHYANYKSFPYEVTGDKDADKAAKARAGVLAQRLRDSCDAYARQEGLSERLLIRKRKGQPKVQVWDLEHADASDKAKAEKDKGNKKARTARANRHTAA